MLTRLYIDSYKCLVNCDIHLGEPINLFLGLNGSGKTSVFEVLKRIQRFVCDGSRIDWVFDAGSRTKWQTSPLQSFELELKDEEGSYQYQLSVEHHEDLKKARVKHERLFFEGKPLLRLEEKGEVFLYRDDFSEGPSFPVDWALSAVGAIPPRHDNTRLTEFKKRLKRILVVQPVPPMMAAESPEEAEAPSGYLENFLSWYRFLSRDQGMAFKLMAELKQVLPGFDFFKFEAVGEKHRRLKVYFKDEGETRSIGYDFDELSDGQRMLIALYTLLYAARSDPRCMFTLCLDEPENFLALPEIQPWLLELYDSCSDGEMQTLLISHHPELIDYLLASPVGLWFERDGNRPARIRAIDDALKKTGLPFSEIIARGWMDA